MKKDRNNLSTSLTLGSSETTREAPLLDSTQSCFCFDGYLAPQHKKTLDHQFLTWFVGFTEGDGSFIVRKDQTKTRVVFEIVQKDNKLIHKIRTCLGFGRVQPIEVNEESYWKYSVSDKKGIERLISLFYSNLVLPKRVLQFQRWVTSASTLGICSKTFQKIPTCHPSVSLNTAWLSGFVEAEGCFYAHFTIPCWSSRQSSRLNQKFHLTQQDLAGEKQILQHIGHLFQSRSTVRCVKQGTLTGNVYRLEMCSVESHQLLIEYLLCFPLQGKKQVDFVRWRRVFLQRQKKQHLTEKGIERMKRLCQWIRIGEKKRKQEKTKKRMMI